MQMGISQLTVGDTLRVPVGLRIANVIADELEIDFVLDVGHHDESCDDTLALAGGHGGTDLAVPHVEGRGQQGADSAFGHGQSNTARGVLDGVALRLPVDLGVVAQVVVDGLNVLEVGELVVTALADRVGHAGVEIGGHGGIASTQAEGADTAVAVHWYLLVLLSLHCGVDR